MSEQKVARMMLNIEPTLASLVQHICTRADKSQSDYLRGLVIQDLHRRGLITVDMMVRMTTMSVQETLHLITGVAS